MRFWLALFVKFLVRSIIERVWEKEKVIFFKVMEIPRIWRETPTRVKFDGRFIEDKTSGMVSFKYPGGQVPMAGSVEQISERLERRGFNYEAIEEILNLFYSTVATETTIPSGKVLERVGEPFWSEVGK